MYCNIFVVSSYASLHILVSDSVLLLYLLQILMSTTFQKSKRFHLIQLQLSIIRRNGNAFCVKNAIHYDNLCAHIYRRSMTCWEKSS